jgi:hypothetical protein
MVRTCVEERRDRLGEKKYGFGRNFDNNSLISHKQPLNVLGKVKNVAN